MSPRLLVGKIIGSSTSTEWSYVYDSTKVYEGDAAGQQLYVVLGLKMPSEIREEVVNTEISSFIKKHFFSASKSPFSAFKSCLEYLCSELEKKQIEVSMSALLYAEDAVYVAAAGGGEVVIFRGGGFSKLLVSKDRVVVASGYPKDGDVLYLVTSDFELALEESHLQKAVRAELSNSRRHMTGFIATVTPRFNPAVATAAGLFCLFDKREVSQPIVRVDKDKPLTNDVSIEESPRKLTDSEYLEHNRPLVESNIRTGRRSIVSFLNISAIKRLLPRKDGAEHIQSDYSTLDEKGKKTSMSVGIIIIVLLIVSIAFGGYKKRQDDLKMEYLPRLEEAQHEFDEALTVLSISPDRARDHFQESSRLVEELQSEGIEDPLLGELASQLENERGRILGEYTARLEPYVDLSLQSDGFSGDDMFTTEDALYILDRDTERAIEIELDSKRSEVIAGPGSISNAHYITAYNGIVYVVSDEGLVRIDSGKDVTVEEDFTSDFLPYSYAGNIYLVDTNESRIYRFSGFEGGLSDADEWLAESAEPDLSKIASLSIDGNIWMVSSTGGVFKFSLGNQVNFTLTGVVPAFSNPTQIYTNEELEYLYVLEPDQKRIVVLTKEGVFVSQYISDGLSQAIDFGVNEEEKKFYMLTGEKIESIELRHL